MLIIFQIGVLFWDASMRHRTLQLKKNSLGSLREHFEYISSTILLSCERNSYFHLQPGTARNKVQVIIYDWEQNVFSSVTLNYFAFLCKRLSTSPPSVDELLADESSNFDQRYLSSFEFIWINCRCILSNRLYPTKQKTRVYRERAATGKLKFLEGESDINEVIVSENMTRLIALDVEACKICSQGTHKKVTR